MAKKYNYNYVFLFYDVGEKRVNKVFKVCKKYLIHYQKSVFRGEITPANLIKLKSELRHIIDDDNDFISIIKLISRGYFSEDILGRNKNDEENLII